VRNRSGGCHGVRRAALLATVVATGVAGLVAVQATPAFAAPSGPLAIGQAQVGDHRVLSVDSTANNTDVRASSYVSGTGAAVDRQRWTFDRISDTQLLYVIRNVASGRCLETSSNGARAYIATCSSTARSQFWLIPTDHQPVGDGYNLRNLANSRCLDAELSTEGQLVDTFSCYPPEWSNPATGEFMSQRWKIRFGAFDCLSSGTLMCIQPGEPMFGVFASWRQYPVSFTGPDDAAIFQYVGWQTLNDQGSDDVYDYFELGWQAGFEPTFGTTYSAYWQEDGPDTFEFHSLAGQPGGTSADGGNHTYMALAGDSGELDIFYDFNPVGVSNQAEGRRFGYAETGLDYFGQNTSSFGTPLENRVQLINGNNVWRRPRLAEVSTQEDNVCGNPPTAGSWGQPNTVPWCFTSSLAARPSTDGPTEVDRFTVTKPVTAAANLPVPAQSSTTGGPAANGPAVVYNGVDQRKLAACMAGQADRCLQEVAGLAECVAARNVCNLAAAKVAGAGPAAGRPMTAAQARTAAQGDLAFGAAGQSATAGRVMSMTAAAYAGATHARLDQVASTDVVHVVSGDQAVSGLQRSTPGERTYLGYRLVYHAATGTLLYACLGANCPSLS
jgi:hypothetical protein